MDKLYQTMLFHLFIYFFNIKFMHTYNFMIMHTHQQPHDTINVIHLLLLLHHTSCTSSNPSICPHHQKYEEKMESAIMIIKRNFFLWILVGASLSCRYCYLFLCAEYNKRHVIWMENYQVQWARREKKNEQVSIFKLDLNELPSYKTYIMCVVCDCNTIL